MTDQNKTTPADTTLGNALCGKLRELAALPPTVRSLMQLEHTARLSRELLVAAVDPYALKKRSLNIGAMQSEFIGAPGYDMPLPGGGLGFDGEGGSVLAMAPSSFSENFGASVLRELGAAKGEATTDKTSVLELVAAIGLAREKGLHELADKLEATLMKSAGGDEQPSTPKTIEASGESKEVTQ
jgi:hypothetical protein